MQFPPKMPIILADFHNLAVVSFYQAQRTAPNFKDETPETAREVLHGVLNSALSAVGPKKLGPCLIAGAWDSHHNWRHEVDPEYKEGSKSPMDPKSRLGAQMHRLKGQLAEFGILCEVHDGLEADDSICLLARHPELKGRHKVLFTRDRDALAYVNDETYYYNPQHKKLVTPRTYEAYTAKVFHLSEGLRPQEVPVFRAMAGDTSDQIPGVTQCGDFRALEVVKALRAQGDPLTGPGQPAEEVKAIFEDLRPHLPANLQFLTEQPAINQMLHYYELVRVDKVPAQYSDPIFAPLQERFPARPTKEKLMECFDKYRFGNFRRMSEEYGWGMGIAQAEPTPSIER